MNCGVLRCRWCGCEGFSSDFDLDEQLHAGFWCPDCDGFTAYLEEANERHRMLLLLETNEDPSSRKPTIRGAELSCRKPLRKRVSPLRYPGGKSKVIDAIFSFLQHEHLGSFAEVFAGGASLGLSLLDAGVIDRLVLNDADPMVYSFWHSLVTSPGYLISRVESQLPSMEDYWDAKDVMKRSFRGESFAEDALAWAMLLLNRTNFSGIILANPLCGKNGTREQLLSRWNQVELVHRLKRISELAKKIVVFNMDCCDFVDAYGYWFPEATLFCDPPYVKQGPKLYPTSFTEEDHKRFAWCLENAYTSMPGPDIVITYDNCDFVRELYPLATHQELFRTYSIAN